LKQIEGQFSRKNEGMDIITFMIFNAEYKTGQVSAINVYCNKQPFFLFLF